MQPAQYDEGHARHQLEQERQDALLAQQQAEAQQHEDMAQKQARDQLQQAATAALLASEQAQQREQERRDALLAQQLNQRDAQEDAANQSLIAKLQKQNEQISTAVSRMNLLEERLAEIAAKVGASAAKASEEEKAGDQ